MSVLVNMREVTIRREVGRRTLNRTQFFFTI